MDIVLVYPPFVNGFYPSAGLSVLKSALKKNKIESEVFYANLLLKKRLMFFEFYEMICSSKNLFEIGEFVFAEKAFPDISMKINGLNKKYKEYRFFDSLGMRFTSFEELNEIKIIIPEFLDETVSYILSKKPKIVGFHITFSQINSSIAIANAIKKIDPQIITIIGGYMANRPMADEILKIADSIDYAFSGEAEHELVRFADTVLAGKQSSENRIIKCERICDLDSLPIPDFTDFFKQIKKLKINTPKIILFESSRGCWWGQKSHCLFCGTGNNLAYRQKSVNRINKELKYLVNKYDPVQIITTDNIIPYKLGSTKKEIINHNGAPILYEVKSNFEFDFLVKLKKSNIAHIQPGIETLSTKLLNILKKGTNVFSNLIFLRNCLKTKIRVIWNFLYGIPGEIEEDYLNMIDFLPFIYHLPPPVLLLPLFIQRFSPLFERSDEYNLQNIRPYGLYNDILPDDPDIGELSVYFKADFPVVFDKNPDIKDQFFMRINEWRKCYKAEFSIENMGKGRYEITDTRPVSINHKVEIDKKRFEIFRMLCEPIRKEMCTQIIKTNGMENDFFDMVENKYILFLDGCYFSPVVLCS